MALTVTAWVGNYKVEYNIPSVEPVSLIFYVGEEAVSADTEIKDAIREFSKSAHCTTSVRASYVEEQLAENSQFFLLKSAGEVQGFIMASVLADGGIYLDVICSLPGTGKPFLNFFLAYCEKHGAPYAELNSLLQVLGYYPPFGFQHRKECTPGKGANVTMSPELAEYIKKGTIEKRFTDVADFYGDPYILNFAWELFQRDFSQTTDPNICNNKTLSPAQYRQYSCARDGFAMRKCFGMPPADAMEVMPFKVYVPTIAGKKRKRPAANAANAANANVEPLSKRTRQATRKAKKSTVGTRYRKSQKARPLRVTVRDQS
jgi:hypothetical protein